MYMYTNNIHLSPSPDFGMLPLNRVLRFMSALFFFFSYRVFALLPASTLWRSSRPSSHAPSSLHPPVSSSAHGPGWGVPLPPLRCLRPEQYWQRAAGLPGAPAEPRPQRFQPQQGFDAGQVPALHGGFWNRSVRRPRSAGAAWLYRERRRDGGRGDGTVGGCVRSLRPPDLWRQPY